MGRENLDFSRDQEVYCRWNLQRRGAYWVDVLTHILTNRIFVSRMRKAFDLPHCIHFQPRNVLVHRFTSSIVDSPTSRSLLATGSPSNWGCLAYGSPLNIDGYRARPRDTKMRDEQSPHSRSYHEISQRRRTLQPFDQGHQLAAPLGPLRGGAEIMSQCDVKANPLSAMESTRIVSDCQRLFRRVRISLHGHELP
jgi:hypothetical protein